MCNDAKSLHINSGIDGLIQISFIYYPGFDKGSIILFGNENYHGNLYIINFDKYSPDNIAVYKIYNSRSYEPSFLRNGYIINISNLIAYASFSIIPCGVMIK